MSFIGAIPLQFDFKKKDFKVHTFKCQQLNGNGEKETFNVEKSIGTEIEMICDNVLSFQQYQLQ
jgi:hypothetical protein